MIKESFIKLMNDTFNLILRRTNLMATVQTIVDDLNTVLNGIQAVDSKLDDITSLIATLKAGAVSQEEIDALAVKVEEIKAATSAIVVEAQSIE